MKNKKIFSHNSFQKKNINKEKKNYVKTKLDDVIVIVAQVVIEWLQFHQEVVSSSNKPNQTNPTQPNSTIHSFSQPTKNSLVWNYFIFLYLFCCFALCFILVVLLLLFFFLFLQRNKTNINQTNKNKRINEAKQTFAFIHREFFQLNTCIGTQHSHTNILTLVLNTHVQNTKYLCYTLHIHKYIQIQI